jgi:hypothetical protein
MTILGELEAGSKVVTMREKIGRKLAVMNKEIVRIVQKTTVEDEDVIIFSEEDQESCDDQRCGLTYEQYNTSFLHLPQPYEKNLYSVAS